MAVQIQLRRDSAANWTAANPTLAQGEVGYETNTGKLKIGDGATAWTALDYFLVTNDVLTESTVFAGDTGGLWNVLVTSKASTSFQLTSDVTITSTGTLNDYALSATASVLRWNGAGALTLSGMTGGTDGRLMVVLNVTTTQTLTIDHDAASTASNRFICPTSADLSVGVDSGFLCIYDATSSRWRIIAVVSAAAGGSTTYAAAWKFS